MPGHRINGIEEESRAVPRHNHKYDEAMVRIEELEADKIYLEDVLAGREVV